MNRFLSSLAVALLLGASACKSNDSNSDAVNTSKGSSANQSECLCGEQVADMYGCHLEACASGAGNPDNPHCACAALVPSGAKTTSVSFGGEASSRELGRAQNLLLADGSSVRGVLREDDGLSITLELSNGASQTIAYDDLAPRSVYRLMKGRTSKSDAQALIALANYTRDHGLYAYSKHHYQEALDADPSVRPQLEPEVQKLRDVASADMLKRAQDALKKGDEREAEKQLSRIISELPNEPAAETARKMMGDLAARSQSQREIAEASTPSRNASAIQKALANPQKRYDRAVEENRKGMVASAGSSQASNHFDRAVSEGERGRKDIQSTLKKNDDLTGLPEAARSLDDKLVDIMVTANLNQAGIAMSRTSFNKALNAVNQALLLDPQSSEAASMKARIEDAAATSGIGNGWGGWYLGTGAGVRAVRAR